MCQDLCPLISPYAHPANLLLRKRSGCSPNSAPVPLEFLDIEVYLAREARKWIKDGCKLSEDTTLGEPHTLDSKHFLLDIDTPPTRSRSGKTGPNE